MLVMEKGDKVKIISVSRGQQYDISRPIEIGAEGIIESETGRGVYFIKMIDPLDNLPFILWFHGFDLEKL